MTTIKPLWRCGFVCLVIGLSLLSGCQLEAVRSLDGRGGSARSAKKGAANPYAQVAPEVLDPTLTADELDRMFLPLESVGSDLDFLTADPNFDEPFVHTSNVPCPDDGRKAYLRGRWLLAKGKVTEAIGELKTALACDPNSVDLIELLSRAMLRDGRLHRAEALCRAALRLAKGRIQAYQMLGDIYFNRQDYSQAIALYRVGLSQRLANRDNPLTMMMQLNLATALTAQGYYQAGLTSYHDAYRLLKRQGRYSHANPAMGHLVGQAHLVLVAMAGLHLQMGEMAQAVDLLDETLEVLGDVDLIELFVNSLATQRVSLDLRYRRVAALCEYLLAMGYPEESTVTIFYRACEKMSRLTDFTRALGQWTQPARGFRPLLDSRGLAYGLSLVEEYEQAEAVLLEALAGDSKNVPLYRELALLYRTWQRWGDMMDACSKLLNHTVGQKIGGEMDLINESIAQIDRPIEVMEKWQRRNDFTLDSSRCFLLGRLAEAAGDEKQSEHFYRQGLSLNREFYLGLRALCELLLRQERYEDVLELTEGLNGDSVDDPELLWYAGRAHSGLEQYDQAEEVYRRVLLEHQDQWSERVVLSLGDVLVRQGAFEQAELIFLEALDKGRDDETIYPHLLALYGGWNAQADLTAKLREESGRQVRKIFRQWLEVQTDQARNALDDWTTETAVLEALARRYQQGKIIHLLLSELYARQKRFSDALTQLEPFLEADEHDEELLALAGEYYVRSSDFAKATEVYRSLWQLSPDDPQRFLRVLTGLRLSNQAAEAVDLLLADETQSLRKNTAAIGLLQDESYRLFGITRRYGEAAVLYREWFDLTRGDGQALSESNQELAVGVGRKLIWALEQTENYDEAIEQIKILIETFAPKDMRPVARLVRLLNVHRRFDESLELLAFLLELHPDKLLLHHQRAFTLVQAGRAAQAIEKAETWYHDQPEDPKRRQLLLTLLKRCGQFAQAIQWIEQWQGQAPSEQLAFHQFELLLESGQFEQAEALLENSAVLKSNDAVIFEARIQLATRQGHCQDALTMVDEIAGDKESPQTHQLKARILASCGDYEKAIEMIELAIELDSEPLGDKLQKSMYLEKAGRIDDAIAVLEALLVEFPNDAAIQNNLGYILLSHHQDLQRSGELLEASYRLNPESGATLDSLGWLYYKRGEFELALRYLYQATAALFQIDAEIWDHLGDTAYQLGQKELAKYYWQQAMEQLARRSVDEQETAFKESVSQKLEQLRLNQEVAVAEVFGLADPVPRFRKKTGNR